MALARAHTWAVGDLLKSADLNGEFNNILNNPISLVSPTTGAINFNLQTHTGILPSAITATSGSAGNVLTITGGSAVWGSAATVSPTAFTTMSSGETLIGTSSGAAKSLSIGSTGQILTVSSSKSDPAWGVIPIDGGLSTTVPTAGMVYYISSSAGLLKGLTIGTSGQVLTVTTSGVVGWAASAGGSGSAGSIDPTIPQFYEDFKSIMSTTFVRAANTQTTDGLTFYAPSGAWSWTGAAASLAGPDTSVNVYGYYDFVSTVNGGAAIANFPIGQTANVFATNKVQFDTRWKSFSALQGQLLTGLTSGTMTTAPGSGVFLLSTTGSGTVSLVVIGSSAGGGSTTLSAGVTCSSFHTYKVVISSSSVDLTVDGAAVGSITAFIPAAAMAPIFGFTGGAGVATAGLIVDYVNVITSGLVSSLRT